MYALRGIIMKLALFLISILCLTSVACQFSQKQSISTEREPDSVRVTADQTVSLKSYQPYKYEVLFTDPVCGPYFYKNQVKSVSGKALQQKPLNTFCIKKNDLAKSGERSISPQKRLIDWIEDKETKEVFFTYLTFSNKAVLDALCIAAKTRKVKVKFVLSAGSDTSAANELVSCSPENIQFFKRGEEGGLGLAHNKIMIVNPDSADKIQIVFSSGNMTGGPVLHHENWHFVTTNVKSYFAQMHLCVMRSELSEIAGRSASAYSAAISQCRLDLNTKGIVEESDIKTFFVPNEGIAKSKRGSATQYMLKGDGVNPGIETASQIWFVSHRISNKAMFSAMEQRLLSNSKPEIRFIGDDDLFYAAHLPGFKYGGNERREYNSLNTILKLGAQAKFLETNPTPGEGQLLHSKYLIFDDKALLCGSPNLTDAGFKSNWENIYYITIPEVVQAFRAHHLKMWNSMATSGNDLPAEPVTNSVLTLDQ